jgi:tetratricopeptide (TPR) repeat protein
MLSKQPDPSEIATLLEHNQEVFQFLLAFVQMSRGLKIGFIEVNFPPDIDKVITAIAEHPKCASIQFVVLRFDDRDMRFLLEGIKAELLKISIEPDKKLVLILQGLEKAIAYSGENPPILTNLNYARDSFPISVPHPLLFALPDYAVTRFAQFAPDFWAWTSSTFKFQTLPETRDRLTAEVSSYSHNFNRYFAKPEQGERIDLLERLLQEYTDDTEASSRTRLELLNQLGQAHQSIREFDKAKFYFQQAINLSSEIDDKSGKAEALHQLGSSYFKSRDFESAKRCYHQSIEIKKEIGDLRSQAKTYHQLGWVAQELREYGKARQNYQQALAIRIEFGDRYEQAGSYHQMGRLAEELREYEEAQQNYQQALAIDIEFGDRYSQAVTYHQLGMVAQKLRKYEEARQNYQQALAIYIEFGDRYSQARTYHQLGMLAQGLLGKYEEVRQNYQQALAIYIEFGDRYSQANTYHQLGIVAQGFRKYEEARQNYQQALAIYIEFGDRYSLASTYHQLGRVAEDLEEFPEAKNNFLQALNIWHEFKDEYSIQTYCIPSLSRIYQVTQDQSLLEAMAKVFRNNPKYRKKIKNRTLKYPKNRY